MVQIRRSKDGPWYQRLFFEPMEFEIMMDGLRARAGEECYSAGTGIDVDHVLLKAYGCDPDYVELPPNILGKTIFTSDGGIEVLVSSALAEDATQNRIARRRLRTTIAHEIGHIACHRRMFLKDNTALSLFEAQVTADEGTSRSIMCREASIDNCGYSGEWWEFQANQCMAALLLPRVLLSNSVVAQFKEHKIQDFHQAVRNGKASDIIRNLCDQFDVSYEAMFYRLNDLEIVPKIGQYRMELQSQ